MRSWIIGGLVLALLALPSSCLPFNGAATQVNVGSKKFTESVILGEMLSGLAQVAGVNASHYRELGGTTLVYQSLAAGEIDIYPEYTGTIREEILRLPSDADDQQMTELLKKQNIRMSQPLGFNNTYAIGMLRERAESLGIKKISDLAKHPQLAWGMSNEFLERSDGWPGLKKHYQLSPQDVTGLDQDLAYQQLRVGSIDCMDVYSTDAKLTQFDVIPLEDDLGYFPRYDAVLLYRESLQISHLELVSWWLKLENAIDTENMVKANALVELDGSSESQVALNFLQERFGIEIRKEENRFGDRLTTTTWQHIQLVRQSLLPAILIAIPLGVIAYRSKMAGRIILAVVSVVQTIPSLALLVMLIPVMSLLGFRSVGLGSSAAILALFLYSLLPIVRNVYSGLTSISGEYIETAQGLGLTKTEQLFDVELPLAWASILSGIKTAAVLNVGFATLGALIGAGGYGQPILSGIRLNDTQLILEGAIPAALLALTVQYFFDAFEYLTTPRGMKQTA